MSPSVSSATTQWVEDFLTSKIAAGFSVRTVEAYRHRLYRFRDWLGERPLTRATLRGYLASLHDNPKLGPVTVAMYFRDVGVWCRWLVAEKVLEADPSKGLRVKIPQRRPASYSIHHITRLLAVADVRDRALILTLLDTGLRIGELVSLRRDSIDWATGAFTVVGKGDKERSGWMSQPAIVAIQAYIATREDADPALWYGRSQPLSANGTHQAIRRLALRAGIRAEVRRLLHAFRATFAKHYIQRGGDLESLRRLLGHTTITMAAYYATLADDELARKKAQVNPLGAIIDPDFKP